MSNEKNQVILTWKDVVVKLRRKPFIYDGRSLTAEMNNLLCDAISLWYMCGYDLLLSHGITRDRLDLRWLSIFHQVDSLEIFRCLKDADSLLLRDLNCRSYVTFKQLLSTEYPFAGALLAPLREVFVLWFSYENPDAFDSCHSWLAFPSRLNFPNSKWLEKKALDDYLAGESVLKEDGFTSEETDLITSWYPRTFWMFSELSENFQPKHGNGSVAEGCSSLAEKYQRLGSDHLTDYLDHVNDYSLPCPRRSFRRVAKLQFVPKSFLTYRSISMEPTTLMWYQQGILRAFVHDLENRGQHPLRKRFHPADQESNRYLAWEGSLDGSFATIDLSSASDSVSWALVKQWFRFSSLYRWMLCSRSSRVKLPTGAEMSLKKFAPMGSALCFPTECIVFAAITECAIREIGGNPITSRYRIYGDDIIIESRYASAVISRLERNGFQVNTKKTFCDVESLHHFRESCGGEYLDGVDVTPLRLSRWFSGLRVGPSTPGRVLSLIDLANECHIRYPSVRLVVIRALMSLPIRLRPKFDNTGETGLFSVSPTNWHLLPPVWIEDYQAWYSFHGNNHDRYQEDDPEHEAIRLYEWLRQAERRRRLIYPEDRLDVHVSPLRAGKWSTTRSSITGLFSEQPAQENRERR